MRKLKNEIKFIKDKEGEISYIKEMINDLEKEIKKLKKSNLKKMILLEELNQMLYVASK